MKSPVESASVILCVRNCADTVGETIRSLKDQAAPEGLKWEIVVVDNASEDETRREVETLARSNHVPTRYVFEGDIGLSRARNRGLKEAAGQIVAYIDADALAERKWIGAVVSSYADPRVIAAGGRLYPLFDSDVRPTRELAQTYTFDLGPHRRDVRRIWGSNMSFRRQVLVEAGGFDASLGHSGSCLMYGEDTDICYRLRCRPGGGRMVYNPDAVVRYRVTAGDISAAKRTLRHYCTGVAGAVLDKKRGWSHVLKGIGFGTLAFAVTGCEALLQAAMGQHSRDSSAFLAWYRQLAYFKELLLPNQAACRGCERFHDRIRS